MQTPDSLTMFVECAKMFLRNEVHIPISDEAAKYLIVYHFDSFSSAYMRYRETPNDAARELLLKVIETACDMHAANMFLEAQTNTSAAAETNSVA